MVGESTKSKQKRQHTYNSQPAIVVKDALVPARDEKLSISHATAPPNGWEENRDTI